MEFLRVKPRLYQQSRDAIWLDLHISHQLLKAHLDQTTDGASRKKLFISDSVNWIASLMKDAPNSSLLDLGCGPGLYAEKLALKGYAITGIDFSAASITYALASAKKKKLTIQYFLGNYVDYDFATASYDCVLLIYCDLGVFSPAARKQLFRKIYQLLKPGGLFIFDVFTSKYYQSFGDSTAWEIEVGGFWSRKKCLHLQKNQHYVNTNTYLESHYLIYPNHYKEFFIWDTVFTPTELKNELHQIGFSSSTVFGDVAGASYDEASTTFCLVVQK
ncbi:MULTISPECIES: class I SAM-dependent methyltransferase [Enterococcus]|uniref:Methyltransferase domain-containing protein n=1 Tax=Enterococcus dispar ATCC 51266 TaxID=1139219 RepID=S1NBS1_9ENTE|nr:class I SAM-dependent methyltransferase [Enterococcus dispar]EOT40250.1 hypothetical protein OMK_02102 [Enterococcus dispar ATCC 51266]EOW86467.1 hypothetical protein I569_01802 [Enterococcus dispar ATCC 51266]MCU7357381.1 class I SAM-dependent methyltransferase [Enterococcus dispar]MDT2706035.1 class I SAM-dependent methyltransferase [Enterococcus dispar]OJG39572.1 hypothetical protein RV01_GL001519 [Enterococcus dispar]